MCPTVHSDIYGDTIENFSRKKKKMTTGQLRKGAVIKTKSLPSPHFRSLCCWRTFRCVYYTQHILPRGWYSSTTIRAKRGNTFPRLSTSRLFPLRPLEMTLEKPL
ncbi:hypothetical protein PUN28_011718 [Cardiocondyla obscurior]|uniref:Uncharacterized protein n=1 Tax=Cardiocondyla obscurior TaxID=286306 RepID=A0AAW2FGK2_9HYME